MVETIQDVDLLAELLGLYRLQRHDVLNHFQVVMGYLQLGKSAAALDYLRQATADIMATAPLSRVTPPQAAVELMLLAASCFKHDVKFGLKADGELPEISWTKDCSKLLELVGAAAAGSTRLDLSLSSTEGGVKLEISLSGLSQAKRRDLAGAAARLSAITQEDAAAGVFKAEAKLATLKNKR